jgi:hypothetical protein
MWRFHLFQSCCLHFQKNLWCSARRLYRKVLVTADYVSSITARVNNTRNVSVCIFSLIFKSCLVPVLMDHYWRVSGGHDFISSLGGPVSQCCRGLCRNSLVTLSTDFPSSTCVISADKLLIGMWRPIPLFTSLKTRTNKRFRMRWAHYMDRLW